MLRLLIDLIPGLYFETPSDGGGAGAATGAPPAPPSEPAGPTAEQLAEAQRAAAEATLRAARAEAMVEFPNADREILNMLSDPDQIRSAAERTHQARTPAVEPAPSASSGPAPTPGPGGGAPPEDQARVRRRQLSMRAKQRGPGQGLEAHEAQELFDSSFSEGWNTHVGRMKRAAGAA